MSWALAITLSRLEYVEIASAKPGRELTRAMADVVKDLMIVLGEDGQVPADGAQVEAIRAAIAGNLPEVTIEFPVARLCARYAQQAVPSQKKILKSLERAATFKKNREVYLQAHQQAQVSGRRAAAR
ncbi:hypothetical protein [Microvirga roseola]|uniref:hypothetical protein n=1 Tax=Microvirga roseola TaxID=2883126 RepID=UPI001E4EDAD7|nr:hypothetical protein [Microvirga roseola]